MPRHTLGSWPRIWAAALLVVVAAVGCSRCEKKAVTPQGVTRYVPRTIEGAVIVPDLGVLGDRITLLQSFKIANFAAQLQGFPDANAFANALVRQVGVDLRSRDELKKAGIDPAKGLAVALLSEDAAFAVVGVSDAGALANTLEQLARNRLGAGVKNRAQVDGREHVWFSRSGTRPELGYLIVDGFALIAPGQAVTRLPEFAKLPLESSLSEDAAFKAALGRLPNERDVLLHVPANVTAKTRVGLVGLTAVAHLSKEALVVNADAPWPDSQTTLLALERKDGPDLTAQLPSDAFVVARLLIDPVALDPIWPTLVGPYVKRAFDEAKLDVKTEVLGNLQPGAVASLSVSPSIPLASGMPQIDVRRTNPFRYAHLVALARPKQPAKVSPLLARMPEVAPRFGAHIEPLEQEGRELFVTRYAQGEGIHFAQGKEGDVVFASPLARLEKQLAAVPANSPPPALLSDPALKSALGASALNVVVDLNQLRDSVRALPPEAWGIGGFAIKASALRWLDATNDLRAITVNAGRKDNFVQAQVALRFAPK